MKTGGPITIFLAPCFLPIGRFAVMLVRRIGFTWSNGATVFHCFN